MTKTYLLAMYFGPIIPLAYPVTAISFFIEYWVNKYVLLRRHSRPEKMGENLNRSMLQFIPIGGLLNSFNSMLYHYMYNPDSLLAGGVGFIIT